jgi:transcriptional regulator with XRE-family HTH domain
MSRRATRHFDPDVLKTQQASSGLTTESLAREIGIGVRVVQKWRSGEVTPSGGSLVALSEVLGCPPESFYTELEEAA